MTTLRCLHKLSITQHRKEITRILICNAQLHLNASVELNGAAVDLNEWLRSRNITEAN